MKRAHSWRRRTGAVTLAVAGVSAILAHPDSAAALLGALGADPKAAYAVRQLLDLALSHALLAALAVVPAAAIGIVLGIAITRPSGRPLRPFADTLVAASQAVPPIVVVALAFPVLGFGIGPTVLALVTYCVMPVLRATAAALETTEGDIAEAGRAMGMTPWQILWSIEIPLAFPVVADALRIALILAIATAAVGALAGASTLGTPIIIGLQNQNEIYILQGAAATAALAFLADGMLLIMMSAIEPRERSLGQPLAEIALTPE